MALVLSVINLFGQTEVKGRVLDLNDNPVPGTNVLIKGTAEGTAANSDDYFTITLPYGKRYKQFEQSMELDKKLIYEIKVTLVEDKLKNKKAKSSAEVISRPL